MRARTTTPFWKRLGKSRGGNATLIVALGMPALIGGSGLAVDMSQWYMWKRELQHSVDQAAIAGAWALAQDKDSTTYVTRARQEYSTNLHIVRDDATDAGEITVTKAGFAGGTDNSVIVSARTGRKLPFSSFLTGKAVMIRAVAQATFAQGGSYNACLISTAEDGTGTSISGNATVDARCGLAALSCEEVPPAIQIDGSSTVITDSIAACGKIQAEDNEDVATEGVTGLADTFADLVPPDNTASATDKDYCKKNGNYEFERGTLYPGTYKNGLTVRCETVLRPGIYVIDGGTLDLTANYNVVGTRVMFVLKNGAQLKLGGSGNGNKLNLTPMEVPDFYSTPYASQAERLAGMLIFEHRDNNPDDNVTHIINGNSNSLIEGTIYLPASEARINGTANIASQCLQISAYRINILGGAELKTMCPIEDTNSAGSARADVRLVA